MTKEEDKPNFGYFNLLIIVLSLYILGALITDSFFRLSPEESHLLYYIDNFICGIFLIDFCIGFFQAKSKLDFMKWGWIDLISSIPAVGYLRFGRAFRLVRLLRAIKAFRSTHHFIRHIFRNRAQGALTTAIIIASLLIIFSSIAILQVEDSPKSNIKTAGDALWWSYVTITTVGYGDTFPVTTEGRIIGVLLMTGGIGVFGTFTAYAASWFVGSKEAMDRKS